MSRAFSPLAKLIAWVFDWVEIGVVASAEEGDEVGRAALRPQARIGSGEQTIAVTVPREPVLVGIDPYHLLDWEEDADDDISRRWRLRA